MFFTEFLRRTFDYTGVELIMAKKRNTLRGFTLKESMNLKLSDDEDNTFNNGSDVPLSSGIKFETIKAKMQNVTPDGKIKKFVRQKGAGEVVPKESRVTIKYSGYFKGQNEPYVSSDVRGKPEKYRLNQEGLILGLTLAIESMQKNEISIIWIHPDYAYGELGCASLIPPNAEVIYVVHLLDFINKDVADVLEAVQKIDSLQPQQSVILAKHLIAIGTDKYKQGKTRRAIRNYKYAADFLELTDVETDELAPEFDQLLSTAYEYLAICYREENMPGKACNACKKVPNKTRTTYMIHGTALMRMGEMIQAMQQFKKALELGPANPEFIRALMRACESNNRYLAMERDAWSQWLAMDNVYNDIKRKMFIQLAKRTCLGFLKNEYILRQPFPESLTAEAEEILRTLAESLGLSVTTRKKRGNIITYLQKPNFK